MSLIVCIVEGDGDRAALPLLIRRIAAWAQIHDCEVPQPIKIKRGSFVNDSGYLSRYVQLAKMKAGHNGSVLVVFDSDNDDAAALAERLHPIISAEADPARSSLVIAVREFESWFVGASESIAGTRGLRPALPLVERPDEVRNPKAWIRDHMVGNRTYSETVDQPAFAATFDWTVSRQRSPSLDRLCEEVLRLLQP